MDWWIWAIVLAVAGDLAITLLVLAYLRKGRRLIKRLRREEGPPPATALPDLARTYAERAGAVAEAPGLIRIVQRCQMRFQPDGSWHEIKATSTMSARRPGFVWLARLKVGPLSLIAIVDALVAGRGTMQARLLSLVPLASAKGDDSDRAQLLRYLGELPWAPDALLHNGALSWRVLGDRELEVTAPSAAGEARLRLFFDEAGDIVRVSADDRPRASDGALRPTPWEGTFSDYRQIGQRRLPAKAEVAWLLAEGRFVYWRGEITDWRTERPGRTRLARRPHQQPDDEAEDR
ncbi:MAG: hypothetical protein Kilf2KO_39120 [Rhodospirillales bacterium]